MGMAVKDEIGVLLAKAGELRIRRVDIGAARLPRGRMHQQQGLAAGFEADSVWAGAEPVEEFGVATGPGAGAIAERSVKPLFVVAEDRVLLALPEDRDDLVREAVFPDAVAEADQLVDIAHQPQRLGEAARVAVKVRDDAEFHGRKCLRAHGLGGKPESRYPPLRRV